LFVWLKQKFKWIKEFRFFFWIVARLVVRHQFCVGQHPRKFSARPEVNL
jgi:hypothetical protein